MTLRGVELIMARRQIHNMIQSDPVQVVFRRKQKESTGDGGWRWTDPMPLAEAQTVALIPFKRRMTDFLKNTEMGPVSDLPYVLLGYHYADIQKDDLFTIDGQEFEVKTLDIGEPEVKTAAHVDYYGGGINA